MTSRLLRTRVATTIKRNEMKEQKDPRSFLELPYRRVLIYDAEAKTHTALIEEFGGCAVEADTPAEALALLDEVAESWIEATQAMGTVIPEPIENEYANGNVSLRMSKDIHRKVKRAAAREGVSVNRYLEAAAYEKINRADRSAEHEEIKAMLKEIRHDVKAVDGKADRNFHALASQAHHHAFTIQTAIVSLSSASDKMTLPHAMNFTHGPSTTSKTN